MGHSLQGAERLLTYEQKWVDLGPNDCPVVARYLRIEGIDPAFLSVEKRKSLSARSRTASHLLDLLARQFKKSVSEHGSLSPAYEADIDARIALAKRGEARFISLLSIAPLEERFEIYAMAGIYPDFGEGIPLQVAGGTKVSVPAPSFSVGARRERVRIFGSGENFYFAENEALGNLASETELVWGDRVAVAFFAVPQTSYRAPDARWQPNAQGIVHIDWKTILLNLAVADGLLRFGERPVPGGNFLFRGYTDLETRWAHFQDIGRAPLLAPELLGLAPQTKTGISEIVLFTRSETLATLFFPALGFTPQTPYRLNEDPREPLHYTFTISREDLEFVALERLRSVALRTPFFTTTLVGRRPFTDGAFTEPGVEGFLADCVARLLPNGADPASLREAP